MSDHENVGYLTWDEWRRFRTAVDKSLIVVPWFRVAGYLRNEVANDRVNGTADHPLGVPPTWLAAEEITRLSAELRYWPNLEDVANDADGAFTARLFTRELETALHRWPIEDKARNVRQVRCQQCVGETIRYRPPQFGGDKVHIACTECGHEYTEDEFKTLIELVTEEMKRTEKAIGGTRRLGAA